MATIDSYLADVPMVVRFNGMSYIMTIDNPHTPY